MPREGSAPSPGSTRVAGPRLAGARRL